MNNNITIEQLKKLEKLVKLASLALKRYCNRKNSLSKEDINFLWEKYEKHSKKSADYSKSLGLI